MRTGACIAALMVMLSANAWTQTAFVPGFEDLPLAPNLMARDAPVAFVTPAGRIIESIADLRGPSDDMLAFYESTLPQMGWVKQAPQRYVREGETLVVDIHSEGRGEYVVFRLTPVDGP